jgi:hypothetical protein
LQADSAVQICGIAVFACFVGECKAGIGRHIQFISPSNLETIYHWLYFHSIIVTVGISLVKISVGLLLLRLMPGKWYQRFLWAMMSKCIILTYNFITPGGEFDECVVDQFTETAFLILFTISCSGTLIFACVPIEASWNFALRAHAKCFSKNTFTAIGLYNSGESFSENWR